MLRYVSDVRETPKARKARLKGRRLSALPVGPCGVLSADSSGNAAMNQKLSIDRGQEVVAFLIQNCNVPVRRVVGRGQWALRVQLPLTRARRDGPKIAVSKLKS